MQTDKDKKRFAPDRLLPGFTLTELIVVVVIVSLFATLVQMNLLGLLRKHTFRSQIQQFISTMQMAAAAAAESDRRYEVFIDITEQSYYLREITTPELSQVLEEEIIIENEFSDNCRVIYVLFDDMTGTDEIDEDVLTLGAIFRAGHAGWQHGGKIVFIDEDEQPYSVIVNRLNRIVKLEKDDVEFLMPKEKDEMFF